MLILCGEGPPSQWQAASGESCPLQAAVGSFGQSICAWAFSLMSFCWVQGFGVWGLGERAVDIGAIFCLECNRGMLPARVLWLKPKILHDIGTLYYHSSHSVRYLKSYRFSASSV